jgi:hypothetical protein
MDIPSFVLSFEEPFAFSREAADEGLTLLLLGGLAFPSLQSPASPVSAHRPGRWIALVPNPQLRISRGETKRNFLLLSFGKGTIVSVIGSWNIWEQKGHNLTWL